MADEQTSEEIVEPTSDVAQEDVAQEDEQGPGWMPAILAATALMGIVGFIFCAFSTWLLFQKRTEFAIRTLRGAYISEVEQSYLDPKTKASVTAEVESLADDLERGKYENWQAAAIMQRLQRLPVLQWGELQAVEAFVRSDAYSVEEQSNGVKQLSRLRRAVELGQVTSFDFEDLLKPVRQPDSNSRSGHRLIQPITTEAASEVVHRAKLLADQSNVPDQNFEVELPSILQDEIRRGASEGGF